MASGLREQILDRQIVQAKTILVSGGYQTNIYDAYRPPVVSAPARTYIVIFETGDEVRWHLRGANEVRMGLRWVGHVEKANIDEKTEAVNKLVSDIARCWNTDPTWNSLARRSIVTARSVSYNEAGMPTGECYVDGVVLFREDRTAPTSTKAI